MKAESPPSSDMTGNQKIQQRNRERRVYDKMQFHDPPNWSRDIPADRLVISMQ